MKYCLFCLKLYAVPISFLSSGSHWHYPSQSYNHELHSRPQTPLLAENAQHTIREIFITWKPESDFTSQTLSFALALAKASGVFGKLGVISAPFPSPALKDNRVRLSSGLSVFTIKFPLVLNIQHILQICSLQPFASMYAHKYPWLLKATSFFIVYYQIL